MSQTSVETDSGVPPAPVFVVGMPRSGTTLVSRLLETSGPYVALPESHFFSRFLWVSVFRRSSSSLTSSWQRFSRSLKWPLAEVGSDSRGQPDRMAAPDRYRRLFLAWVGAELGVAGVDSTHTAWVENSPPHTEALDVIRFLFPRARIIGMVRDPRAVHSSLSRVNWNSAHPAANAVRWRLYARALRERAESDPDHLHLVRYEDLVADPVSVIGEVGRWLDVPLDRKAIEADGEVPSHGFDPVAEPWKALALSAPDSSRIDGWREKLPDAQRQCIEYRCADEMRRFGYEAVGGPRSLGRGSRVAAIGIWLRVVLLAAANRARVRLWRATGIIRRRSRITVV